MFRHHPDHWIYINNARYPLAWWLMQEPSYNLPAGAIGRDYNPDNHVLYSSASQWAGETPWQEGDAYIAKAEQYEQAWQEFQTPQPIDSEPTPDIGALRLGFLGVSAYHRILSVAAIDPKINLGIAVSVSPCNLYGLQATWNAMIASVPAGQELSEVEVGELQAIANAANFNTSLAEIAFQPDGTILVSGSLTNV